MCQATDVVHEDGSDKSRIGNEGVDAEAAMGHLHQEVAILTCCWLRKHRGPNTWLMLMLVYGNPC